MSLTAERLYALLPAVYRLRDETRGKPLYALLAAFAHEFAALEENLDQLYDDQFIETCADWVAPYIGDIVGYRPLHGVAPRIASPRAEVANTIRMRRRKGTALALETLARDVTAWPAHALECFERLATSQYMKHVRLDAPATPPVRDPGRMLRRDTAFDAVAHLAEMRRPESGAGRYNIPNVALFLWRLEPLPLTAVPLTPHPGDASKRKFRVNPLGADLRLFRQARTEADTDRLAGPLDVPDALRVRTLALAARAGRLDDYGAGRSLLLSKPDGTPVPVAAIRIADLRDIVDSGGNVTGWNHEASLAAGTIGIDPERGRVLLGSAGDGPLAATFRYAQAREIGGGEYARAPDGGDLAAQRTASGGAALQPWLDAISAGGRLLVEDSLTYAQTPAFKVDPALAAGAPGHQVVVAAKSGARPLLAASGDIALAIGARGRLVLDGLVISGGALHLAAAPDDEPRELVLRDCTLVPGLALAPDGRAASPGAPSLVVEHPFATVTLERCIVGALRIVAGAQATITDSIVDAGAATHAAYAADAAGQPGGELRITDSTVLGTLHARLLSLASNCLFAGRVDAERRQEGCVRFSYVPRGSIAPRRYRCVPDDAHPDALPHFASLRYGEPAYMQLRRATDRAIREGADDGGEMGALHALFQPQRETNLRLRLDEYLRFGLHAGLFYVT
ncbi:MULTISPECIES: hypothetical protein [unclassified Burkholderia]|uniref:hypothetical protein n=1 Tax=unclassified Burkholderia TaxID=2613784 RepID=UPI000758DFA2|nr:MULTISPECIES: hypothetical protein [unclassified Burkholderia]KVN11786.1 hypothetical protein WT08_12625 [Burkholderia sp. MSMB1552]KWZ50684.1 hypothetical protein WS92_25300 [Burkholderia sp. MSMB1588]